MIQRDPEDRLVGRRMRHYRIGARLGWGPMGGVYAARRGGPLRRRVALKVVWRPPGDGAFGARFCSRAALVAQLGHPGIAPIYDFGEASGFCYLVTELAAQGTLAHLMRRGQPDLLTVARIVTRVAAALDHAHRRGILHGNLKPSNVLVYGQDRYVLADFALGRPFAGHGQGCWPPVAFMSPYTPPELVLGRPVDGRGDGYALAALAFELLTGQPPSRATSAGPGLLRPALIRQLGSTLSETVQRVLDREMDPSPAARYPTAGAFARALGAALGVRQGEPPPRRRMPLALVALGATLALLVALMLPRGTAGPLPVVAALPPLPGSPASGANPGQRIAFVAGGNPLAGEGLLLSMTADGGDLRQVSPPGETVRHAWSPDGRRLGFVVREPGGEAQSLYVAAPDGTNRMRAARDVTGIFAWDPTSRLLAYARLEPHGSAFLYSIHTVQPDGSGDRLLAAVETGDGLGGVGSGPVPEPALGFIEGDGRLPLGAFLSWRQDGRGLVGRDAPVGYFRLNADGSDFRQALEAAEVEARETRGPVALALRDEPEAFGWQYDGLRLAWAQPRRPSPRQVAQSRAPNHGFANNFWSGERRLTRTPDFKWQVRWSSDGRRLLFSALTVRSYQVLPLPDREEASADLSMDLWAMNADGAHLRRLTTLGTARRGEWQPAPA